MKNQKRRNAQKTDSLQKVQTQTFLLIIISIVLMVVLLSLTYKSFITSNLFNLIQAEDFYIGGLLIGFISISIGIVLVGRIIYLFLDQKPIT